ncbi:hypothetical protein AGMMS49992_11950 [Clostridia bacterium]|nr:hypothetical protein AGMMS49992_11950 [Clostridia bacterium]
MPIRTLKRVFGRASPVQALGVAGESSATILSINVSAVWETHPAAEYSIMVKRGNEEPYPAAALLKPVGGIIDWIVPMSALEVSGDLVIEIQASEDGVLLKSYSWRFWVGGSMTGGGNAPTGPPSWFNELLSSINSIASPVVWCETKHDRPTYGAVNTLYIIGDAAYVWNEDPPKYMPLMFDADEPTQIDLINGGEET